MDETWLYHFGPETKQQSMEWRHSGSYRLQKILSAKHIRWNCSSLDFLGPRRHPPHWLSSKRPNYKRRVFLVSVGAIEEHFEGKTPGKLTKGVLFFHDNAPAHRENATQKKLAYLGFHCVDPAPYSPDMASSDLPRLKKNRWKVNIFRPTRRSLLPRRRGWTNNVLNVFE